LPAGGSLRHILLLGGKKVKRGILIVRDLKKYSYPIDIQPWLKTLDDSGERSISMDFCDNFIGVF
jgi:hypothetical protein